jgi:large subunit ribosomal protein L45
VDPFRPVEFAKSSQQRFIDTNAALQDKDKHGLRTFLTENAVESLKEEVERRQFVWKFLEQIERPRVVNAKIIPMESKDNYFAQVVVRLHSSQIMVVYNAVGQILRGHPSKPNRVIDYVVMERHLETMGGGLGWRIAGKLPPQIPWKKDLPTTSDKPQGALPTA